MGNIHGDLSLEQNHYYDSQQRPISFPHSMVWQGEEGHM